MIVLPFGTGDVVPSIVTDTVSRAGAVERTRREREDDATRDVEAKREATERRVDILAVGWGRYRPGR